MIWRAQNADFTRAYSSSTTPEIFLISRSPTHGACMQVTRHAFEPRPHLFVDHTAVIMIWRAQNADFTRAYSSSTTPDKYVFSMFHTARLYSSARSRALATSWSRAYCAITLMASNT